MPTQSPHTSTKENEMKPETIRIDEVEYVRKDSINDSITGNIKIVILQRGWVMVGYFERTGNDCKLSKASVIRKWGTTKGLGEIAGNGPTKDTVLDKCYGVVEFDYLTVVAMISVEESKWQTKL
jgi:hypothetical protein